MIKRELPIILELIRKDEKIRISAYEKTKSDEQTLKHYEDNPVSFAEIDRLCKEIIAVFNRANRRGDSGEEAFNDLRRTGQALYDELFTPKVKDLLRSASNDTLVLYLDDQLVHIPWELLFDGDDFLCLKFSVGRIVSTKQSIAAMQGREKPASLRMLILADPRANLEAAYREGIAIRDELEGRLDKFRVDLSSSKVDTQFVRQHIRDYDIVHYAGHAEYDLSGPSQAGWLMADKKWTAADIGKMAGGAPMPFLVFSNACHSGRTEEWQITEGFENKIYGLANAFLLAGVSHYIGSFWEILDSPSSVFASAFYRALAEGVSVGAALRTARRELRGTFGNNNLIWASYMLYGDPGTTIFRGGQDETTPGALQSATSKAATELEDSAFQRQDALRSSQAETSAKRLQVFRKWPYVAIVALLLVVLAVGIRGLFKKPAPELSPQEVISTTKAPPLELTMNIIGQREERDGTVSEVLTKEGSVLHSHDNFQVHFQANKDAHVYVLIYDSTNEAHQLFPDPKIALNNNIKGVTEYSVPTANQWFWLDENIGTETIYVLASEKPLNNIQSLLKDMETAGAKEKKALSEKIRSEIVSLERGVGGITEGKAKSYRLKDGKSIENITEIVKGAGVVARAVSFRHIARVSAKDNNKFKNAIKNIAKDKAVAKAGSALIRSSETIIKNAINTKSESGVDEKAIAKRLSSIQRNIVLEKNRGVGGVRVYKEAGPSVVLIATKDSIGSGSVIDKQGHIVTNWHVINGYDKVVVFFKPENGIGIKEENAYLAKVEKVDEITDLALIKLEKLPAKLPVMKVGSMNHVEVAQEVHAIGHPEGEIWTYTKGIISQIRPQYEWSYEDKSKHKSKVIQTQTPINPGNSGGPLLNDDAELIGINSFTKRGEGLNFAVSVDVIKGFLESKTSRLAQKPATQKASTTDAMKNAKYYELDLNKDGITDVVAVDTDGNGKIDMYVVDENEDGVIDYVGIDSNENGKIEAKGYDTNKNNKIDTWAYDTDEDGKIDLYGLDDNEDGEIDEYRKP